MTSKVRYRYAHTKLRLIVHLLVGTPPQNVSVIFDTGSFTLEFTSGCLHTTVLTLLIHICRY